MRPFNVGIGYDWLSHWDDKSFFVEVFVIWCSSVVEYSWHDCQIVILPGGPIELFPVPNSEPQLV